MIGIFKEYDQNIVFRDCRVHCFLNIYSRRKDILLISFRHFVELPAKFQLLLD